MIVKTIWTSMLDYPKQISTVLFVGTCNWRCGFCHNLGLLNESPIDFEKDILPKLLRRKKMINHIIISGGECLYDSNIENYINILYDKGFKVGIHTNGDNFYMLNKVIDKLSFVGMDIKTSFKKYKDITNYLVEPSNIIESLKLIKNKDIQYDIRTTVYKRFVDIADLISIANLVKDIGFEEYNIQKYIPINTIDETYTNDEILEFENILNNIIKTKARGLI